MGTDETAKSPRRRAAARKADAASKAEEVYGKGKGWADKLNRTLFPWIGPPPLGPYNEEPPADPQQQPCPLCGKPMNEHEIDRSGPRTQLYCPK